MHDRTESDVTVQVLDVGRGLLCFLFGFLAGMIFLAGLLKITALAL